MTAMLVGVLLALAIAGLVIRRRGSASLFGDNASGMTREEQKDAELMPEGVSTRGKFGVNTSKKSQGQKYQKFKEDADDMIEGGEEDEEIDGTRNGNGFQGGGAAAVSGRKHEQQPIAASRAKEADEAASAGVQELDDMEI